MDVHVKLAEIRRAVEDARSMPMSASAVVNRTALLALLDELDGAVAAAFTDASQVVADRDSVVQDGRREADELLEAARSEREAIISDTQVYRVAKREADHLLSEAHTESDELRKETDEYVDAKLANFEITLDKTRDTVRRGRERLAGHSDHHEVTDEEAHELRKETDDYVESKLTEFEATLDTTMDAVRRGRARLAGRSDMHGITDDEVDKIKLPEHLDR